MQINQNHTGNVPQDRTGHHTHAFNRLASAQAVSRSPQEEQDPVRHLPPLLFSSLLRLALAIPVHILS
jgi:hypothetical protein